MIAGSVPHGTGKSRLEYMLLIHVNAASARSQERLNEKIRKKTKLKVTFLKHTGTK